MEHALHSQHREMSPYKNRESQVHAHAAVGRSDGSAYGGHLLDARVCPTCELILPERPTLLRKEVGLWDLMLRGVMVTRAEISTHVDPMQTTSFSKNSAAL